MGTGSLILKKFDITNNCFVPKNNLKFPIVSNFPSNKTLKYGKCFIFLSSTLMMGPFTNYIP